MEGYKKSIISIVTLLMCMQIHTIRLLPFRQLSKHLNSTHRSSVNYAKSIRLTQPNIKNITINRFIKPSAYIKPLEYNWHHALLNKWNRWRTTAWQKTFNYYHMAHNITVSRWGYYYTKLTGLTSGLLVGHQINNPRTAHAQETFTISKQELQHPELLQKRLNNLTEEERPAVALAASKYIASFLDNGYWQRALVSYILPNYPDAIQIVVHFLAQNIQHLAHHSQDCPTLIDFFIDQRPKLLEPLYKAIKQHQNKLEQTDYGSKIIASIEKLDEKDLPKS